MYFTYFQARVHDESLRYVLSDQAIIAIADKVPSTSEDIGSTIAEADLNVDLSSGLASPSPVVCSHLDDFHCLLQDKIGNPDDIFPMILQNCLGSRGSCPISVFNYALLVNSSLKLTLVSKQNVIKNSKHVSRKASRDLFVQKFSCKSPVYHNCRIYANDGRLLCYCDQKKLEWLASFSSLFSFDPNAFCLDDKTFHIIQVSLSGLGKSC